MPEAFDVAVIGGGAAGLSAATWLGRHRRATVLLDRGEHRNRAVQEVHGYLGSDCSPPGELLARARKDLQRYRHVECRSTGVRSVAVDDDGFLVDTDDGDLHVRRLVLATGVVDVLPPIEGMDDHYGIDVHVCPICDGYEAEGATIAVIGWSEEVAAFSLTLLDWAESVAIVTLGHRFEGDDEVCDRLAELGVTVEMSPPLRFVGEPGRLEGMALTDGRELRCSKAFIKIASVPNTELVAQLGCALDDGGYVAVDHCGETSVPGVYAAGDLTPGMQLVQVAAAEGAVAGVSCAQSLRGELPRRGAPEPAPPAELLEP